MTVETESNPNKIVGSAEAAEFLGVTRGTLLRWAGEGLVPAFRVGEGGRWRFLIEDLEDWLERQRLMAQARTEHKR